jgi:hypothetical protein
VARRNRLEQIVFSGNPRDSPNEDIIFTDQPDKTITTPGSSVVAHEEEIDNQNNVPAKNFF